MRRLILTSTYLVLLGLVLLAAAHIACLHLGVTP